jgi:hypothetical protein
MSTSVRRRVAAFAAFFVSLASFGYAFVDTAPLAIAQPPAGGGGSSPSVECATGEGDPYLWNGEYWKVQVTNGTANLANPETNLADDAILFVDATPTNVTDGITWENNDDSAVFRIVRKEGQQTDPVINGYWAPGEGGSFTVDTDISHITFCFTDPVEPPEGSIRVVKDVQGDPQDDVTEFDFSITGNPDFTLNAANSWTSQTYTYDAGTSVTVAELTELSSDWSTTVSCTDGESSEGGSSVTVEIEADTTITCTFVNTYEEPEQPTTTTTTQPAPQPGRIIVVKAFSADAQTIGALPAGVTSPSFGFTPSWGAGFGLKIGESKDSGNLVAGAYSVAESPTEIVDGEWKWQLVPGLSSCSDGSPANAVVLSEGETVTCTFVNTRVQVGGIQVTTTTTAPPTTTTTAAVAPSTLPFTGPTDGSLVPIGIAFAMIGLLLLAASYRKEEGQVI